MKKNPVIHLLFVALCWFISFLPSQAQFDSGVTGLTEAKLVDRSWHLSSKEDNNPLLRASGNVLFANNNTINAASTFVIDDGPKDNKWWTSDIRWFHIKNQSTGQYITVQGNTPGVAANLAPLIEGQGEAIYSQQFRLVATVEPGWYKLRSRLSESGPNLVLEINGSGQLIADSPKVDPSKEQKFAFNLALPGGSRYAIISNSNRHFFSDNGILSDGTPAVHIKNANASVVWQFQAAGGGYYRFYNTLTKMYLALPAGGGNGSELIMTTSTGTNSHWQLVRNNNTFFIAHRSNPALIINMNNNPDSGNPLYCTVGGVVGREWIITPLPDELTPISGNFERIADGDLELSCAPAYGTIFKKGLIERVGLNPENTEPNFAFIREAIAAEAGANKVDEMLIRFDLNNPGHRVDLALMVRKYITEVLPLINRNAWSPEANQAVSEYEERVRAVRLDHANRITAAWTAYSQQFATETMGFSQLIANIDASGFVWPEIYQLQGTQADLTADYTVAANSFGYRNNAIVGSTFIGVSVALGASNVVASTALFSYLSGLASDGVITITASFSIYNTVVNLAPPVAIGVIAATSIAVKAMEVSELQELLADIDFQVAMASAPVSLNEIMSGLNLVDRTQLLSDLDYLIGAPVTNGFQFNTDDNFYQPPFTLNCLTNVTLSLDANGAATLTPAMCGSVLQTCGTPVQYFLTKSQFDCGDLGTNQVIFVARNKVDENAANFYVQRCTLTVTVIDEILPTITCPGNQTLTLGANCSAIMPDYIGLATNVSDNCGQVTVTQSPEAGTVVSGGGDMVVTLRVSPLNGATVTCTFIVTKIDNTPPLVVCPLTQTLVLTSDCTAAIPDYRWLITTYDACGISSVVQLAPPGAITSGAGSITALMIATDVNNNVSQCSFTINKVDNTLPTVQCFPQTLTFNGEEQIALHADDLVDATDHCGLASLTTSPSVITCDQIGQTIPVTVTVTDINGNVSTCISQVTVTGLPCGWIQNPDGVNCAGGSSIGYNTATGVFTTTSTNCYYASPFTSDAMGFAQSTLCGNGSITAQVTSLNGLGWAGIMLRESNAAGAKKVQLTTNMNSGQNRREVRYTTNGDAYPQQFPAQGRYWLRLVRQGNQVIGYTSANGVQWFQAMAVTVSMGTCIEAGLVLSNFVQNSSVTSTFANVSIVGSGSNLVSAPAGLAQAATIPVDFSVFPNPTTGELNVDLSAYANKTIRLEVYDNLGKALQILETETMNVQLDLSAYQSGLYLIRVKSEGVPDATKRVILQRN